MPVPMYQLGTLWREVKISPLSISLYPFSSSVCPKPRGGHIPLFLLRNDASRNSLCKYLPPIVQISDNDLMIYLVFTVYNSRHACVQVLKHRSVKLTWLYFLIILDFVSFFGPENHCKLLQSRVGRGGAVGQHCFWVVSFLFRVSKPNQREANIVIIIKHCWKFFTFYYDLLWPLINNPLTY